MGQTEDGKRGTSQTQYSLSNAGRQQKSTPPAPDLENTGGPADSGFFRSIAPKTDMDDEGGTVIGRREQVEKEEDVKERQKSLFIWKIKKVMDLPDAMKPCDELQKKDLSIRLGRFMGLREIYNNEWAALSSQDFGDEAEKEEWTNRASMFYYLHETSLRVFGALIAVDRQVAYRFFEDMYHHAYYLLAGLEGADLARPARQEDKENIFRKDTARIWEEYCRLEPMMRTCVFLIEMEAANAKITPPPKTDEIIPQESIWDSNGTWSGRGLEAWEGKVWNRYADSEIRKASTPAPGEPVGGQKSDDGVDQGR